jgi:hypothetical protein
MTIFTAADGQAVATRLATEQQAIVESLINLEDHLGRRLLDNTAWKGATRKRRADVLDGFARLWALAHQLLWRAPCDLAIAAAAVTEYQDAVNGTVANGTVANGDGA